MTTEEIQVGTIRVFIRIDTCKRSTGNEGDRYNTFRYWNPKDASKHPKPKPSGSLWTHKRSRVKAVWDGKHWRELGDKVSPK